MSFEIISGMGYFLGVFSLMNLKIHRIIRFLITMIGGSLLMMLCFNLTSGAVSDYSQNSRIMIALAISGLCFAVAIKAGYSDSFMKCSTVQKTAVFLLFQFVFLRLIIAEPSKFWLDYLSFTLEAGLFFLIIVGLELIKLKLLNKGRYTLNSRANYFNFLAIFWAAVILAFRLF